ncbi:MAG TPA: hypothetical protein VGE44_13665 [Daejeonella sp.]|uniref:hypothetical protein n=1 Tax=Daejeonella sp. TaxID=2805397 RepID=UPI002EDABA34
MSDEFNPSVDYSFMLEMVESCSKVIDKTIVGSTTAFVLEGSSPSHKRTVYLRKTPDEQIPFLKATAICIRISKMGELLEWFEQHRSWKDGGYFERENKDQE